jgi:hypothetical protein
MVRRRRTRASSLLPRTAAARKGSQPTHRVSIAYPDSRQVRGLKCYGLRHPDGHRSPRLRDGPCTPVPAGASGPPAPFAKTYRERHTSSTEVPNLCQGRMWIWVYIGPRKRRMGRGRAGASIPNEEIHGVVGRFAVGVLERPYGLDRPRRAHLRWVGAVPFLQRGEEQELVRLRVLARSRLPPSGCRGRKRPAKLADRATVFEAALRIEPFSSFIVPPALSAAGPAAGVS